MTYLHLSDLIANGIFFHIQHLSELIIRHLNRWSGSSSLYNEMQWECPAFCVAVAIICPYRSWLPRFYTPIEWIFYLADQQHEKIEIF
jgi:hypothetical protein